MIINIAVNGTYYYDHFFYYTTNSHHAWVSFEATAEVYNEVCRDACVDNITKVKHFLKLHPVITKNTDDGMIKPCFFYVLKLQFECRMSL